MSSSKTAPFTFDSSGVLRACAALEALRNHSITLSRNGSAYMLVHDLATLPQSTFQKYHKKRILVKQPPKDACFPRTLGSG